MELLSTECLWERLGPSERWRLADKVLAGHEAPRGARVRLHRAYKAASALQVSHTELSSLMLYNGFQCESTMPNGTAQQTQQ